MTNFLHLSRHPLENFPFFSPRSFVKNRVYMLSSNKNRVFLQYLCEIQVFIAIPLRNSSFFAMFWRKLHFLRDPLKRFASFFCNSLIFVFLLQSVDEIHIFLPSFGKFALFFQSFDKMSMVFLAILWRNPRVSSNILKDFCKDWRNLCFSRDFFKKFAFIPWLFDEMGYFSKKIIEILFFLWSVDKIRYWRNLWGFIYDPLTKFVLFSADGWQNLFFRRPHFKILNILS